MKTTKKIGLALGSGGIRGFALIGVLQALEENNIPIDIISGSSSGSMVAAHYAIFKNPALLRDEIIKCSKENKLPSFFDLGLKGGLIRGGKLKKLADKLFGKRTFSDTKIPLNILSTDLVDGRTYAFSKGNIASSVQASCTVPVLFEPFKTEGHYFVDGGLSDPVPVAALKNMGADITIGVSLYHKNEFFSRRFTVLRVAMRSSRIAVYNLALASLRLADIAIIIDMSPFTGDNKFKKYITPEMIQKIIRVGYKETIKQMPEIKRIINK
jgi:NTE family protein